MHHGLREEPICKRLFLTMSLQSIFYSSNCRGFHWKKTSNLTNYWFIISVPLMNRTVPAGYNLWLVWQYFLLNINHEPRYFPLADWLATQHDFCCLCHNRIHVHTSDCYHFVTPNAKKNHLIMNWIHALAIMYLKCKNWTQSNRWQTYFV